MKKIPKVPMSLPETIEETLHDGRWHLTTSLPGDIEISTVDLHGSSPEVQMARAMDLLLDPLLGREGGRYETLVRRGEDWLDETCVRYGSEEEARAGHAKVVAEWLAKENAS